MLEHGREDLAGRAEDLAVRLYLLAANDESHVRQRAGVQDRLGSKAVVHKPASYVYERYAKESENFSTLFETRFSRSIAYMLYI